MKKGLGLVVVLFLCLWPLSAFTTAPQSQSATSPAKYCTIKLAPLHQGQHTSDVLSSQCFHTFSESIAAATGGRTHLPATVKPQNLTQAMLDTHATAVSPQSSYVLSVEYWDWHYQGATWAISSSLPCDQVSSYGMSYVGSDWNDGISSAIGYSNCNHVRHWDNANYWGANIDCNSRCYTMGAMNDHTSSIEWWY
ncbi:conserved hypothetical protein [Ktedonobacter racemifer DSM 44963]|uniref:Uncharacterized protein n=1 Tax=Ktedonobacter racemifer DSM 44963 TaxID=485913 RepID=D6TDE1_KTERA|nr:conserved hypothetical protein [Ktedonobacter racemifer DSM 44963]